MAIYGDISPDELQAYLAALGWVCVGFRGNDASVWSPPQETETETADFSKSVIVPNYSDFRDYTYIVERAVNTLSNVRNVDQSDIVDDIKGAGFDILLLRRTHTLRNTGIPLTDAVRLISNSYELLSASAQSEFKPKPVYASKRPKQVEDFLGSLCFGHTRPGSFILPVYSPVAPLKSAAERGELFSEEEAPEAEPYSRRVFARMASAIDVLLRYSDRPDSLEQITETINDGVSANLCRALRELFEGSGYDRIEISVKWSIKRPIKSEKPSLFLIDGHSASWLQKAEQRLREHEPQNDNIIFGYVIRLDRNPEATSGRVTVLDVEAKVGRRVTMRLGESMYKVAIAAHSDGALVACVGNLYVGPRSAELQEVKEFEVINVDDE